MTNLGLIVQQEMTAKGFVAGSQVVSGAPGQADRLCRVRAASLRRPGRRHRPRRKHGRCYRNHSCLRTKYGAIGLFGTQTGHIDTLVLGCTHYPFVSGHLQALVGADVRLVQNGEAVAQQVQRVLLAVGGNIELTVTVQGRLSLFTACDAQTLHAAAAHWLGVHELVDSQAI